MGQAQKLADLSQAFTAGTLAPRNLIINPHMAIQQETVAPVSVSAYFADQWVMDIAASGAAVQAGVILGVVSAFDPSNGYIKTTTAKGALAAGDSAWLRQPIEGLAFRRMLYGSSLARGSYVRWRASASQVGTASVSIRNGALNRSFVQTFDVSPTPTDYSLFVPGDTTGTWPTDTSLAAHLSFCFASGTTGQTSVLGTWQAGNFFAATTQSNMLDTVNRQLNITDVQWVDNPVLLPFCPVDWADELRRCMRYWQKSYDYGTALGTNTGLANGIFEASGSTADETIGLVQFPVPMRIAPTPTVWDRVGNITKITTNGVSDNVTPNGLDNQSQSRFKVFMSAAHRISFHYTVNARY